MIFKNLFKAKWQHHDLDVRLQGIAQLDAGVDAERAILVKLINTDDSDAVCQQALKQINDKQIYLQYARSHRLASVRRFCEASLQDALLQGALSAEQKTACLALSCVQHIGEDWLLIEQDDAIAEAIIKRIEQPKVLFNVLIQVDSQIRQKQLVEHIDSIELLQKALKKVSGERVKTQIDAKLESLISDLERPNKLERQVQLLLAKRLALKEQYDYNVLCEQQTQLEQQWYMLQNDFGLLTEQQQTLYNDKFIAISEQLNAHITKQKALYQARYEQQLQLEEQQKLRHKLSAELNNIDAQIKHSLLTTTALDTPQLVEQLQRFPGQIQRLLEQQVVNADDAKQYMVTVHALQHKLNQFDSIADAISEATSLLSRLSEVKTPTSIADLANAQTMYEQWQQRWQSIDQLAGTMLPESIQQARRDINTRWSAAITSLASQQRQHYQFVVKKLAELKRLISSGKYKSAFGLHTKLAHQIPLLSARQQTRVTNEFNTISERIESLRELEHFVVTPRKKALLATVCELVEKPLSDLAEQASLVKQYRQRWNTLGQAEQGVEQELNEAFNLACEDAFAPCRDFFAQQQAQRVANLAKRQQLLTQIESLAQSADLSVANVNVIADKLRELITLWHNSGDVDRHEYKALQQQFQLCVKPLQRKISGHYQTNANAKKQLIEAAKAQLSNVDLDAAVQQLKLYQRQWRDIGFAGSKQDNLLWKSFRKINDKVFALKASADKQQQRQLHQQIHQFNEAYQTIVKQTKVDDSAQLTRALSQLNALLLTVKTYKSVDKALVRAIDKQMGDYKTQLQGLAKQQRDAQYDCLFKVTTALAQQASVHNTLVEYLNDLSTYQQQLPEKWFKCLLHGAKQGQSSRAELTLDLEIAAHRASPDAYKQQRLERQVAILSAQKMQAQVGDQQQYLNKLLQQWLQHGQFTQADIALIERVKAIFIG